MLLSWAANLSDHALLPLAVLAGAAGIASPAPVGIAVVVAVQLEAMEFAAAQMIPELGDVLAFVAAAVVAAATAEALWTKVL